MKYSAYDPSTGLVWIPEEIIGFPYPERFCRRCNQKLDRVNALHHPTYPEIYKAVYICFNPDCQLDDNGNDTYFTKIVYSCDEAEKIYETIFLRFPEKK